VDGVEQSLAYYVALQKAGVWGPLEWSTRASHVNRRNGSQALIVAPHLRLKIERNISSLFVAILIYR
jgi:hypothetical protein